MRTKDIALIRRVGQRREIAIPKQICDALHLGAGDLVAVGRRNGTVVIIPQYPAVAETFLSPEEAKSVRRGTKDVAAGRTVPWSHYKKTRDVGRNPR